ncbi:MAG: hypothetical protein R3C09_28405 [Pirellulaceae bacterium]
MKTHFMLVMLVCVCSSTMAFADLVADVGAGPGVGISVTSGTSITAKIIYMPISPLPFDGVGLDLNWTPTGSGAALFSGPAPGVFLTGGAAGAAPTLGLLSGAGPIPPGTPLINPGVPPAAGALSVGGGAHFDPTGGAMSGGPSYGVPSGSGLLDLMGADFVVTGAVGDTITFTPSGILPISAIGPPLPVAGFAPVSGGAHYWTNVSPGMGLSSMDPMIGSVTVTISAIPEPSSCLFAVVLCGTACIGSRRSRLR